LIIDDNKPELQEVFETYTDTWDKIVKVEILKKYSADKRTIFTMNPDFEDIGFIETPQKEEEVQKYNENFHIEDVEKSTQGIYEKIKEAVRKIDAGIKFNPQRYYISLIKNRNFAYIEVRKKKIQIVIMLPLEQGHNLIKHHTIVPLSEGVQKFYNAPCFKVSIENLEHFEEIVLTIKEAYSKSK
jgi:predicted transport protein